MPTPQPQADLPPEIQTVYYVAPDVGDDLNDGLSPQTPWKTWSPFAKTGRPGTALLLKRGCTFTLPLPIVGGAPGAPVLYGAYGPGKAPLLQSNMVRLGHPDCWIREAGEVWRSTIALTDVANVILDDRCGNMRYSIDALQHPGEWFQDATGTGPLRLFSPDNPATIWRNIEVIPAGNGIMLQSPEHSHIHLQDLHINKVGTHGIQLYEGPTHVTIRRCELSLCGGAIYRNDPFSLRYGRRFVERRVRFGNGIETWQTVSDVMIESCRVHDVFDGGICVQGFRGALAQRVYVRDNVIWNCGYDSLDVAHGILTRELVFEHNTCVNSGEGWALQGESKPRYSVNLPDHIGYHCNMESSFGWDERCEISIHHNIFYNAPESRCLNYGPATPTPSITVDHNCYFQLRAEDAISQLGKQRFPANDFDAYRQHTGWDTHSIVADPLFVDLATADFRLKPNSPAQGMGATTPAFHELAPRTRNHHH